MMQLFDTLRRYKMLLDIKKVLDMSSGFHKLWHISTGVELGIFDNLVKTPMGSQEYAAVYDMDIELINAWMEIGASYGLLKKRGEVYSNTAFTETYLCTHSKHCFANFPWGITSMHSKLFEKLPELMRKREKYQISPELALKVAQGTRFLDNWALDVLLTLPVHEENCKVMDIGCGQGYYLIELAKRNQSLTGIGVELQESLCEEVNRRIKAEGLQDRLSVLYGNAKEINLGENYNICLINNMLYYLEKKDAMDLLKRAKKALKPNGVIAVQQPILTGNVDVGFVHWVILIFGGMGLLPRADLINLLKHEGFDQVTTKKIEPTGQWLYFIGKMKQ
ncbi:MAG: class I SAM-dependent methyltransferase [Candidatus Methanoperedens sp.]|nr:class I SAM-dependent methyltransferase [Candidatus Methanoperedens sp.]